MKKFIIIGGVIIIGALAIWFLITKKDVINKEIVSVGGNLSIAPDVKPITNLDNTNTVEKITKEITSATLHTSKGDITIEFFESQTPKTVANFLKLAQGGFYDGTKFHRVIKDFMIQGGDPLSKDDSKMDLWGGGGPGYQFADEIDAKSDLYAKGGYRKGIVAMANSGKNTNGSQFFIMAKDYPLPPLYTIFGRVISGQDVVNTIENVQTNADDRPLSPVIIESVSLK
ncbi:MAG TPA: peptidylprolyl isomerase [Candidatus Paceibacterota bacterium]|nr:peptidylprolyl isomerase [Candidatus Paceibacterota bacterium]